MLVAAARRPRQYRRLLVAIIVGVAVTSLVASIWLSNGHPTWAFYLLPARMVELLAGAAVAAAGSAFATVPAGFRAALGWFGLVGIAVAVLTYDAGTVFPGYATMLPVLCTVLVITAAGPGSAANGPVVLLRHPGAQWVGKHSYAIYLWHWPALVLVEAKFGPLALPARIVVVVLSVALAAVSVRLVEVPVRHSRWLALDPRRGLALGAALCRGGGHHRLDVERQRTSPALRAGGRRADAARTGASDRASGDRRTGGDGGTGRVGPTDNREPGAALRRQPRRRRGSKSHGARTGSRGHRRAVEPAPVADLRRR